MTRPRLLLIDDNVRLVGGHFFEMMLMLGRGGNELGWDVHAATHQSFTAFDQLESGIAADPIFGTRRMVRWSLGVDGQSDLERKMDGSVGVFSGGADDRKGGGASDRSMIARLRSLSRDAIGPPSKRPRTMLRQWRRDLMNWFEAMSVDGDDRIVLSTADDFSLLALAGVLADYQRDAICVDAIVHFALVDAQTRQPDRQLRRVGNQIHSSVEFATANRDHRIRLHATTPALADQYHRTQCGLPIGSIPYPTRLPASRQSTPSTNAIRCGLAGWPRAEKGRGQIGQLLEQCESLVRRERFMFTAQMPMDRWPKWIPAPMQSMVRLDASSDVGLEIHTQQFSMPEYHGWLDGIDVGLFLYDAERYRVRCSGIAVEMMVRGIPVVVPDGCHMADEVRRCGGHGKAGYIFQRMEQIPSILQRFADDREAVDRHCLKVADRLSQEHHPTNTLRRMGLEQSTEQRSAEQRSAA